MITNEILNNEKNAQFRVRASLCTLIADLFDYAVYDVRYRDATEEGRDIMIVALSYIKDNLAEPELMNT